MVSLLGFAGASGTPFVARADEKQACLTASEKGQTLRSESKMREARTLFQVCARPACPKIVRVDCAKWAAELNQIAPTVVFGARDASGKDLVDVTVSMDGEVLVETLDGKSVVVDPGKHDFKFETNDGQSVTESVVVKEGEKARAIDVSFGTVVSGGGGTKPPSGGGKGPEEPQEPPPGAEAGSGGGHTVLPWIVTGVGVAGVGVGLALYFSGAGMIPDNCDASTRICRRVGNETNAQLDEDREKASSGVGQRDLGLYIAIGGGVVAVGGLVWHFLEPSKKPAEAAPASDKPTEKKSPTSSEKTDARRSFDVAPWLLPGGAGFGATGTF